MDDERKERIAKLAEYAAEKQMEFESLGIMNTPSDWDERKKSAARYAVAEAEMLEAKHALERAKQPVQPPLGWTPTPNVSSAPPHASPSDENPDG